MGLQDMIQALSGIFNGAGDYNGLQWSWLDNDKSIC